MDHSFWQRKWQEETQGFQLPAAHPFLTQYWQDYAADAKRVLVPLCGRTPCLDFLLQQGHEVWGVELSPIAVQRFFHERHWIPEIRRIAGGSLWQRLGLTLFCGDYFACQESKFDAFYDRAALIALPAEMRPKYVQHTAKKLKKKGRGFLITLEYTSSGKCESEGATTAGPPFSLTEQEVRKLTEPTFSVLHVQSKDTENAPGSNAKEHLFVLEKL